MTDSPQVAGSAPPGYPDHAGAVPLYGPRYQTRPVELYREMRRQHGPVVPVMLQGDIPAWLVIGYRQLHQVLNDPKLFSRDCRRWNVWDRVPPDSLCVRLK